MKLLKLTNKSIIDTFQSAFAKYLSHCFSYYSYQLESFDPLTFKINFRLIFQISIITFDKLY